MGAMLCCCQETRYQGINRNVFILATSNGRQMLELSSTIQLLFKKKTIEFEIPALVIPSTTSSHNPHYENTQVLQNALLRMFTYKNLPKRPVRFRNIRRRYLHRRDTNEHKEEHLVENPEYAFGRFAYVIILGACVQVNEKRFELITSSNLYDLSSGGKEYISILSMLCEGDYSTSR